MKFLSALSLWLLISIYGFSQTQQKYILKSYSLINQTVTLHSLANLSRKPSRQIISFNMPSNTIRWYYSFFTIKSGISALETLKLGTQIANVLPLSPMAKADIKALKTFLDNIDVPNGNLEINTYTLNYGDAMNFMNKQPHSWLFNSEFKSTKSGKKELQSLQTGGYFIGLENLSRMAAVDVQVEAIAIVAEIINP